MASSILKTLQDIEAGRQNCVTNARAAGLTASDDLSVNGLGDLFLYKNNNEDVHPVPDIPEPDMWERPSDWPDTKAILDAAEDIVDNSITYYPVAILLFNDISDSVILRSSDLRLATTNQGYLTSDGSWYKGAINYSVTHTWDTTKDFPCSDGYNTRYVIIYSDTTYCSNNNFAPGYYSNGVSGSGNINFPCIEIIISDKIHNENGSLSTSFGSNNSSYVTPFLLNVEIYAHFGSMNSNGSTFFGCCNLRRVIIKNIKSTSSNILNGNNKIEYLSLDNLESTSQVIAGSCYNLRTINIPNLSRVTLSGNTLIQTCYNLRELSIPKLTTSSALLVSACYNLQEISLPMLEDISSGILSDCPNIIDIDLPNLELANRSSGGALFSNCNSLRHISLPKLKQANNTIIVNDCRGIEILSLPSLESNSGNYIASNCLSLKYINAPNLTNTKGVYYCYSLMSLNIPNNISSDAITFVRSVALKEIDLSNSDISSLPSSAFSYCNELTQLNLPSTLESIGNTAFIYCNNITQLNLPNVESIGSSVFQYCANLAEISFPKLVSINFNSFEGCSNLTSITLPSTLTTITGSFTKNNNIRELNLPEDWNVSGLNIEYLTLYKESLLDILDKLADVTEEEGTYTLKLGTNNSSRLTAAELQVATDKGWTIS